LYSRELAQYGTNISAVSNDRYMRIFVPFTNIRPEGLWWIKTEGDEPFEWFGRSFLHLNADSDIILFKIFLHIFVFLFSLIFFKNQKKIYVIDQYECTDLLCDALFSRVIFFPICDKNRLHRVRSASFGFHSYESGAHYRLLFA
jgi:hypothetical protein